jgi:hypothetical protein
MIEFSKRVLPSPSVLVREVGGDTVLLNLDDESYYGLDSIGTSFWKALATAPSIQQAYNALVAEFEVPDSRLRTELAEFVENLVSSRLVHVE